jgi:serine/threonine protein kinase
MNTDELASGERTTWRLLKKLGEGDAGEVYLVESLLEKRTAILKRPTRSAFASDIIRQASQIANEGKILRALSGVQGLRVRAPLLIDQSKTGNDFSDRLFIVIERAAGLDLRTLDRITRFGVLPEQDLSASERSFLEQMVQLGHVPVPVLLRTLACLLDFLETIHTSASTVDGLEKTGILWNDVKPEHLFWDPRRVCITVIDWGNAQFLEADGATKDRRFSRTDDYTQYIQEMGKFLENTHPDLIGRLDWPGSSTPVTIYPEAARLLRERLAILIDEALVDLQETRSEEAALLASVPRDLNQLRQLEELQRRIFQFGELPDEAGALRFSQSLAAHLASSENLPEFVRLCEVLSHQAGPAAAQWDLLARIAGLASQCETCRRQPFEQALQAGLQGNWAEAHWCLGLTCEGTAAPPWWDELSGSLRLAALKTGQPSLPPYTTASRLAHALQAQVQKLETQNKSNPPGEVLTAYQKALQALKGEILPNWCASEPDPPHSGLEYTDVDALLSDLREIEPEAQNALANALAQPKAQVRLVLEAWRVKEFEAAVRGLRQAYLWDPDRRRVFSAELAILKAPAWLERVYRGPRKGELLPDFMAHVELDGRELRSQVGPARWLDLILDALGGLRNGANPADLLLQHPELLNDVPWLNDYDARRPPPPPRTKPVVLEREFAASDTRPLLKGIKEGKLGDRGDLLLGESLDTWAAEARGSSARVFQGRLRLGSEHHIGAIKLMRPDRVEYALPLFREEVEILTLMRDVPGVTGMLEAGYLKLDDNEALPADDRQASGRRLTGLVLRYGVGEVREFLASLEAKTREGWLPYLAMEKRNREDNLMVLCDVGYTRGQFLPLPESLRLAIQICEILQVAHARNIVYRDHKILHFYWLEAVNGVVMIDWNVARHYPEGLTLAEKQFDLVQFGARALHHIITGRTAPGALPLGPNRPDDIESAAHSYTPRWTYDDQRLPTELRIILERVLAGGYNDVKDLQADLRQIFVQLPETATRTS